MPSLYGAGIRIHLASQPLAPSLTEKVELKKGYLAASKTEQAEKALREGAYTFLPEERVPFPSDEGNFALNWLGGAPFLQVVVGQPSEKSQQLAHLRQRLASNNGFSASENSRQPSQRVSTRSGRMPSSDDADSDENSNARLPTHGLPIGPSLYASTPNSHPEPKALVLHVMLTDKTFFHNPFQNSPQHLKIDVFFNGQLSSCVLMHTGDIRSGAKSLNQVFAGTRIDYMAERPWVIHVPQPSVATGHPFLGTTGTGLPATESTDAQERWVEISKALMHEANERGIDTDGERPPTAVYLQDLASMLMPASVHEMQRPGGTKFGVVDVIVTVGTGKKIINGVSYLKAPTRLPDDRYAYQMTEGSGFDLIRAGASGIGPDALDMNDQDAEGDTDSELDGLPRNNLYNGLPVLSDEGYPLPPPYPTMHWQDPFSGSPIPPLPLLEPSTSFVRERTSQPETREPPQKRGRSKVIAPSKQNDHHLEARRQMPPPRRSYLSVHSPSFSNSSSHAPHTGFDINQYDNFEHADPYQLPYTNMITGLNFASFDSSASSPLRHHLGGQLTLPSFTPTREDVMPSTEVTSAYSSPYSQSSSLLSQGPGTGTALAHHTAYQSAVPPTGLTTSSTFEFPYSGVSSGCALQKHSHSNLLPSDAVSLQFSPYASVPYIPPLRRSSNGPPPPMGLFRVTEKPNAKLSANYDLYAQKASVSGILLRRLVIGMGRRVVLAHHFVTPRQLPVKAVHTNDTFAHDESSIKTREQPTGSAESVEHADVRHRSNQAASASASLLDMSLNEGINSTTNMGQKKSKRDSIHDGLMSAKVPGSAENVPVPTAEKPGSAPVIAKTSARTKTSSTMCTYALMHRTADTGILGVQGPKANVFVFDNPEELLRKKKSDAHVQSRSISSANVDVTTDEESAESVQATESRSVDRPIGANYEDTGSSSPLSELSHSPQLSFTTETPVETNAGAKLNQPLTTTPVVPTTEPEPAILPRTCARLSTPATAPKAPSMLAPSFPAPALTSTPLKRKRTQDDAPKRTPKGSYVKPPRSPDRLNAKNNPPLNRDCVIRYAVSERDGGALRQVRSERRGVFKEESVVVGCRFFVAGC